MSEGSPSPRSHAALSKRQSPKPSFQPNKGETQSSSSPTRKSASPQRRSAGSQRGSPDRPTSRGRNQSPSKSPSKSPTGRGKGSSRAGSPLKSARDGRQSTQSPPKTPKDGRHSSQKRQTPNQAEYTESGLKIVDMSGQGMTGIPSSLFTGKGCIGFRIIAPW